MSADAIRARALELGFIACGFTVPAPSVRGEWLDQWLARGYGGTMRYLHRQARRRKNPADIEPEARSIIVVLDNYYTPDSDADRSAPRVAKYARGEDYHGVMGGRLEELAAFVRESGASLAQTFADAGPVPERELAQRAGLGWIGKNTMLIRPSAGSFFFIGSVFTDLVLVPDVPFATDHCGTCTRCIDACPTGAILEPRLLDATRCISYLTIEHKGPIPDALSERMAGWAFGCDICNDVCPWNQRFAQPTTVAEYQPRQHLAGVDAEQFERMDEAEFSARFGDTPLERPGLAGMRRNLKAALGSDPLYMESDSPTHRSR
ncbi:MAG: tRNA epoxyqueuosine(34) reductase QueG [Gemmatimonadales bacterium]|nr:tRNA epoxyqueuosine(34) reductase QueG [Gemmatimonadales bacterium]